MFKNNQTSSNIHKNGNCFKKITKEELIYLESPPQLQLDQDSL